jgi:hypothetical protein
MASFAVEYGMEERMEEAQLLVTSVTSPNLHFSNPIMGEPFLLKHTTADFEAGEWLIVHSEAYNRHTGAAA